MRNLLILLLILTAGPCTLSSSGGSGGLRAQQLSLFELFTEHAVLQRNVDHPIWGWAKPGRKVKVILNGKDETVKTGKDGMWKAYVKTGDAGGPFTLSVTAGRETITFNDIYFGDVYLLSGQSNMEWRLTQSDPGDVRAREIADPLIRQILVQKSFADRPEDHLILDESWKAGTMDEIKDFSGVGSYFAHYLREKVDIPIGLVHSSWGGSRIEPWISAEDQGMDVEAMLSKKQSMADAAAAGAKDFYMAEFNSEPPTVDKGVEMGYLKDKIDESDWGTAEVPGMWEAQGYKNVDGVFYYRRTFNLTADQAAVGGTLFLGPVDDGDLTYINGKKVGGYENAYSISREYEVDAGVLRAGSNTIAVRVFDGGGGGGFYGSENSMRLETSAGNVPLSGTWKYRVGEWKTDTKPNQVATILYNKMIAPMAGWPLTGTLWYQGESNAGQGSAEKYADQLRLLVTSWREHFDNDDMYFYWVQLANYQPAPTTPNDPGWAVIRNQMTQATDLKGTGQAVITDIGEADDIHPLNKWEVGRRLSLLARRDIYGEDDLAANSPTPKDVDQDDLGVKIELNDVGGGLMIKQAEDDRYGYLKGFTAQDTQGKWHWARAIIAENKDAVIVLPPAGVTFQKIRYAWANNPEDANLFTVEGLPVTPFEVVVN